MHTYYELELLGLEFHTLLSILTITPEMSVANVLLLEFYHLNIVVKVRVLQGVLRRGVLSSHIHF